MHVSPPRRTSPTANAVAGPKSPMPSPSVRGYSPNVPHPFTLSTPAPNYTTRLYRPAGMPHPLSQSVTPSGFEYTFSQEPSVSPFAPPQFLPPPIQTGYPGYPQQVHPSTYSNSPVSPFTPFGSQSLPFAPSQPSVLMQYHAGHPAYPTPPPQFSPPIPSSSAWQNTGSPVAQSPAASSPLSQKPFKAFQWMPTNAVSHPRKLRR